MYGILLRLDAGRQKRIGENYLERLIPKSTINKLNARRTSLNASTAVTSPFAPTLIRPSFYPSIFRATDIKTLFWKVKMHDGLHTLSRIFVDEDKKVVFEFKNAPAADTKVFKEELTRVLKAYAHLEFKNPTSSAGKVTFELAGTEYEPAEVGE